MVGGIPTLFFHSRFLWCSPHFVVDWFPGWWYTYPSEKYESQLG